MTDYRYKLGGWESAFDFDLVTGKYHSAICDMVATQESSTPLAGVNKSFKDSTSVSVPLQHQYPLFGSFAHFRPSAVPRVERVVKQQQQTTKNCCKGKD